MPHYAYIGHETVGQHVERCLEPLGWSIAPTVREADIVFTYCTSSTALEDAYFDSDGIVKGARPGTLLVDLSATAPSFARELAAVAQVNDLRPVEAPISLADMASPDAFASAEGLICFVAGEDDDIDEAIDVIETIAGSVVRTGGPGSAQLAKASQTIQASAILTSAIEADALARAVRSDYLAIQDGDEAVVAVSKEATGLLAAVKTDRFEGPYTVEMLMSEVAAAMVAAEDAGLVLPQLESTMHLLELVAVIGGADKTPMALSLVYRDEAASAAAGLDWTRAEGLFSDYGHDHDHGHGHGYDSEDGYERGDGFGDDSGFDVYGGFGGYSAN